MSQAISHLCPTCGQTCTCGAGFTQRDRCTHFQVRPPISAESNTPEVQRMLHRAGLPQDANTLCETCAGKAGAKTHSEWRRFRVAKRIAPGRITACDACEKWLTRSEHLYVTRRVA
jgi:hypothetical protein